MLGSTWCISIRHTFLNDVLSRRDVIEFNHRDNMRVRVRNIAAGK